MTKGEALQAWFSEFLTAYPSSSVPKDAVFPWLTYDLSAGAWGDGDINLTVNLWYYSTQEAVPDAKAQEIMDAIGRGGTYIECDGGAILLKQGTPAWQRIKDESDIYVKRRYLNVTAEYITEN